MCSSRQTRRFRRRKRGVSAYEEIGGRKGESKNNVNLIGLTPKVIPLRSNSKSYLELQQTDIDVASPYPLKQAPKS
ncbi:hypothetical protein L1887_09216 [Cichorium endivia]|nr:hypothetical protein L1887_09216 [Cichorium endivia]